ncbi:MAG: glycosyltransferase, partial [Deltaproteobacteria bacterium]|nr:glycosyltransferase [Deltaproteobacteria bacterium]
QGNQGNQANKEENLQNSEPNYAPHLRPLRFKLRPRILFFDTGYFLSRELPLAAKANGSEIAIWSSKAGLNADGEDYQRLLEQIKQFRPELIMTVNHLGFDAEGKLASVLTRLGLPAASWFVDSPAFILGSAAKNSFRDLYAFSWDRDYLPILTDFGFNQAHFLPLAASEEFFKPLPKAGPKERAIAFVGDSLASATTKYLAQSSLSESNLDEIDCLALEFINNNSLTPGPLVSALANRYNLTLEQTINLEALVTWRASRLSRLAVLKTLAAHFPPTEGPALTIAGQMDWMELVPLALVTSRLDYYRDLAGFYLGSEVNLNITSAQMKTGINQRVFDVPACREFLLTDRREQLSYVFDLDSEVAVYDDPSDCAQKAKWYLNNPSARDKIADKAYRRVIGSHLYRHRLRSIVSTIFGREEGFK